MNIIIFGAGAWGTALAIHFAKNNKVFLYAKDKNLINDIKLTNENKKYLPGFKLPENIYLNYLPVVSHHEFDLAIIATPVAGFRQTLLNNDFLSTLPFLIACKGFEQNTNTLPYQIAVKLLPLNNKFAVLSGPVFAQELAQALPCAICISSKNYKWIKILTKKLNTPTMRFYSNTDPIGTSIGGAVKNIIAIATGVAYGLNYGLNCQATLITRGIEEIKKLTKVLGGKEKTLMGLSGLGDLILTCTGNLSRNRQFGLKLAQGKSVIQIKNELYHITEGANTIDAVIKIATLNNIEMPITFTLHKLINQKIKAKQAVDILMNRIPKSE